MRIHRLSLLAVLVLLPAGCQKEPYQTALVSGRVTLNGKGVAKIAVMFQPVASEGKYYPGPGSTGITDDDGYYTLKLVGKETAGAVVGKHKVRFTNYAGPTDPSDDKAKTPAPAVSIPARYNDPEGKLEFEVPSGGTEGANFQLTSP